MCCICNAEKRSNQLIIIALDFIYLIINRAFFALDKVVPLLFADRSGNVWRCQIRESDFCSPAEVCFDCLMLACALRILTFASVLQNESGQQIKFELVFSTGDSTTFVTAMRRHAEGVIFGDSAGIVYWLSDAMSKNVVRVQLKAAHGASVLAITRYFCCHFLQSFFFWCVFFVFVNTSDAHFVGFASHENIGIAVSTFNSVTLLDGVHWYVVSRLVGLLVHFV